MSEKDFMKAARIKKIVWQNHNTQKAQAKAKNLESVQHLNLPVLLLSKVLNKSANLQHKDITHTKMLKKKKKKILKFNNIIFMIVSAKKMST